MTSYLPSPFFCRAAPLQDEEVIQAFAGAAAPEELQGSVEAVRVVRDKTTGLGKGIAYVMFKSKVSPSFPAQPGTVCS